MNDLDKGRVEHLRGRITTLRSIQKNLVNDNTEAHAYYDNEIRKIEHQIHAILNQRHQ